MNFLPAVPVAEAAEAAAALVEQVARAAHGAAAEVLAAAQAFRRPQDARPPSAVPAWVNGPAAPAAAFRLPASADRGVPAALERLAQVSAALAASAVPVEQEQQGQASPPAGGHLLDNLTISLTFLAAPAALSVPAPSAGPAAAVRRPIFWDWTVLVPVNFPQQPASAGPV